MILVAIPNEDFDPTEAAVPWNVLTKSGHEVKFATPSGKKGNADYRVLSGKGFGPWRPFLAAKRKSVRVYEELQNDPSFADPIAYHEIKEEEFDGLILPGGHAPGMKEYLESEILQAAVASFFEKNKPVGAICHGVVVAARSRSTKSGRSVLYGRKTTALPKIMELSAWLITCLWLGSYFRTYPETVQAIVTRELESKQDFLAGPKSLRRDSEEKPEKGFAVVDGNYISARWPGDAYRFAFGFMDIVNKYKG